MQMLLKFTVSKTLSNQWKAGIANLNFSEGGISIEGVFWIFGWGG